MKRRLLLVLGFLSLFSSFSVAQYTQVGNGGFASTGFGPMRSDVGDSYYSRYAYIYPTASVSSLEGGDTITGLGFKYQSLDSLVGTTRFKIYIKSTASADFGTGALNWAAETRNGMTLVYDGNPKTLIGNTPKDVNFFFNEAPYYVFDTTGGKTNFQMLVEFEQQDSQFGQLAWLCESSFYVPGFVSSDETKYIFGDASSGLDSICTSSTSAKPTLRIHHPRYNDDLEVNRIYALGLVPSLMGRADSIKVVVSNVGKQTITNRKVYLSSTGSNPSEDSVIVSSIAPYSQQFIYFTNHFPTVDGFESLEVRSETDDELGNNVAYKNRLVNYNVYSHADPFIGSSGGIGFNGSTGDFVAKFYVNGQSYMNQIAVDFNSTGRLFQLGVWDDNGPGGLPGTELFMSDTTTSTPGTFIMSVLPRVSISDGFYVGIRQAGTTNVGFSFQEEAPVRPSTFFFSAPAGDTNWVPFSPGFDFNFNIQPRLQVGNDVAVLSVDNPMDQSTFEYSSTDSLELKASIVNYGFNDQGSILVRMEVLNRFSQVIYTDTRQIALLSGDSTQVTFNKFSMFNIGDFTARATAILFSDSVLDNNTKENSFQLVKQHDVAVDIIFNPVANDSFEVNEEFFWPTVRVINYGIQTQFNFPVIIELELNDSIYYTNSTLMTLAGGLSEIINFDSITLPTYGKFVFRAFTALTIDSFPQNDTTDLFVFGKKSHDLQITSIIRPTDNQKFSLNSSFQPFVSIRNDGLENEDSVGVACRIYNLNEELIYFDSSFLTLNLFSNTQVLFKSFNADSLGTFRCDFEVTIPYDQELSNNKLSNPFRVVEDRDLSLLSVLFPGNNSVLSVGTVANSPQIVVLNNGFESIMDAPLVISIENNQLQEIYRDTILVSLVSDQIDTIAYPELLSFTEIGDFFISVKNLWANEQSTSSNDSLNTRYSVRYERDLGISAHISPVDNDTIQLSDIVNQRIHIINYGIDTIKDVDVYVHLIRSSGLIALADTFYYAAIAPNEGVSSNSTKFWPSDSVDTYTMVSTIGGSDHFSANDMMTTTLFVVKDIDCKVDSAFHPNEGEAVPINTLIKPSAFYSNDGIMDVPTATVKCEIFVDGNSIYSSSHLESFDVGESKLLNFDSSLTYPTVANATVQFIVAVNGDEFSFNDTLESTFSFYDNAGVADLSLQSVSVYPNPTESGVYFESTSPITAIRIMDHIGRTVETISFNTTRGRVNLPESAGTYILEFSSDRGVEMVKILKTK